MSSEENGPNGGAAIESSYASARQAITATSSPLASAPPRASASAAPATTLTIGTTTCMFTILLTTFVMVVVPMGILTAIGIVKGDEEKWRVE